MSQDRLDEILEVLMSYARHDFSPRLRVSTQLDEIDAIATGINLLAEELHGEVASRRELQAAYARIQTTQAQLVIAEKFAAVGQLANGVAHELNNPATWVLLGLRAIERRIGRAKALAGDNQPLVDELAAIERSLADTNAGVERMRAVVGDLRTLARADGDTLGSVDLNDVVRSACQLSRPAYHSVAELELDLSEIPPVLGDRGRLGQLVTNLVINAAHAVADREGAQTIAVATRAEGTDIVLAVEDTGPGIPEELWERVFDPYFTTKPSDVGSGLGLALVRNIAARHGGTACVMHGSRPGARVEIRLPGAVALQPHSTDAPGTSLAPAASPRARILIIDDEPMLLRSLQQAVEDEHDVVTALGGHDALERLAHDRRFDLVVCDLQMPNVDGVAVHEALTRLAPELLARFVVMTGGAVTPRATSFLERTRPRSLRKPITVDELLAFLRAALVDGDDGRTLEPPRA